MQTALSDHQGAEAALSEERKSVEAIDAKLREMETTRQRNTDAVESARQRMSEAQLKANESAVRRDTVGEQLTEAGKAPEAALAALPEEADEPSWNAKLEEIARKISRLGAINLALSMSTKSLPSGRPTSMPNMSTWKKRYRRWKRLLTVSIAKHATDLKRPLRRSTGASPNVFRSSLVAAGLPSAHRRRFAECWCVGDGAAAWETQ